VGVTIDKQRATERFGQALVLARSDEPLPEEWLAHAREVGKARSRTFTSVLGTALVARAADETVDVRSLREDESDRGYSARSLAKDILIPYCARAGIDLRTKGKEPLNGQPFLRASRVARDMKVLKNAEPALGYLCDCLDALESLRGKAALEALAAFLRVRIQDSRIPTPIELGAGVLDLPELLAAVDSVVERDDTGLVVVAIVAAALSLVFSDVKTRHANDSTAAFVGNLGAFDRGLQTLALDVSKRSLSEADVLLLAQHMATAGIGRAFILSMNAPTIDRAQLEYQARRLHHVELAFFQKASELVRLAVLLARDDLTLTLASLPRLVLNRMGTLKVGQDGIAAWSAFFSEASEANPS
jgi:hypothetical protein